MVMKCGRLLAAVRSFPLIRRDGAYHCLSALTLTRFACCPCSSHRGHHVDTTLVQHNVQIRHHARSPFRINRNLGGRRNLNPRPQPRHAAGSVSFREAGERAPRSEMGALPSAPCDAECPLLRSPLGPVYARLGSIPAIPLGGIKRVILTTRDSSKSSAPSRSSESPRWYEADCNEGGRAAPPMARP